MKNINLRGIAIRCAGFLITFMAASGFWVGQFVYLHRQALFESRVCFGQTTAMKALYHLGVDVNGTCSGRWCGAPLNEAAAGGFADEVEFLLSHGADVNAPTDLGFTPLMLAARNGHESALKLLIAAGADLNANRDGETALNMAKERQQYRIVYLLRKAGAKDESP